MSNINLLPWRIEQIFYKNNIFFGICCFITVVILIITLTINGFIEVLSNYRTKEIDKLNEKISIYQAKNKEITGLKERKKLLLDRLSIINDLQSQRALMVNILDKIANTVPNGISLKQMDLKGNILYIHANSESNSRISEFMRNLEKTNIFVTPRLKEIKSSQNTNNSNLQFIDFNLEINVIGAKNEKK